MSVFSYERYKIRIAPDSHKAQGLRPGDIVRRQYVDRAGIIYSLMAVIDTGVDVIEGKESPYFVGALLDGEKPQNGELLDFVRVTNLMNPDRSGALYLTASDSEAPFMDVIDGMATEQSLCYPVLDGGTLDVPDKTKYTCLGTEYLSVDYRQEEAGSLRIIRLCRNGIALSANGWVGIKQTIEESVEHPERLLVSFQARASKTLKDVAIQFGYTTGEKLDATDTLDIGTDWMYQLWVITVEYPRQYSRSLLFNLTGQLINEGDWCEFSDLNIVRLSSVSTFAGSTKSRVGKVSGIIDPVYGVLEGYGAYFQRLYATKDVNIAGTLTAGDRNGFSSTFYVGKIHKNVLVNSLGCIFNGATVVNEITPVGIGSTVCLSGDSELKIQSSEWRQQHVGQPYCFSAWIKTSQQGHISVYQDEHYLQGIDLKISEEWQRQKVAFFIYPSTAGEMCISFRGDTAGLCITAPQLERGNTPTPYQATDEILSYVEDYGAWFCRGGVGGTIQNPLLRLNDDGSISSCDGSFVINRDGTGHFANGRFKWTKDTIELRDFTIRWEDLDEVTQEQLKPCYVTLSGGNVFHFSDDWKENTSEPDKITIVGTEHNFEGSRYFWEYLSSDGQWKDASCNLTAFVVTPDYSGWESRDVLSLRFTSVFNKKQYSGTYTIFKQYDGESAYSVYVGSENGTTFRNGMVSTTLSALVYKGGIEITEDIPANNFRWTRISQDTESDKLWNSVEHRGRKLEITRDDVWRKAVFDCEILISKT